MLLSVLSGLMAVAWWLPNRPTAGNVPMPATRFNSVSFSPYRANESPLTRHFPTRAEVDQDLGLIATRARAIRTYSAIEGDYDLPALVRAHGLTMWQGIWLGPDRAANAREIAAGIRLANANPDVITRVIVGNEVLLRKDLPPDELIADIDQVKHAVKQSVTYADVWNFFVDYPQVAPHVDVLTIHILPYWEDQPTNIDHVIAHERDVLGKVRAAFPGRPVAIGETGWPSRGRWRQDAAPGLVNQAVFLRRFIAFAQAEGLDYNFFQSFDEVWKYQNEGVVGASWGLWTADRTPKFPLSGPVQEDAQWYVPAALSVLCGWLLYAQAAAGRALRLGPRQWLAMVAMLLGGGLGFAWIGTAPVLFDRYALVAALGNLGGQAALALLFMQQLARRYAGALRPRARTGRDATNAVRLLLRGQVPAAWRAGLWHDAAFDDLSFLFVWTAAVLQLLLLYDPRYRDFPLPTFAVPVLVVVVRAFLTGLPLHSGGREEAVAGAVLLLAAVGSAIQEGALNLQSLEWNACAVVLAAPPLLRLIPRRSGVP